MYGWIVTSTLTDTYGTITETLSQGVPADAAVAKMEQKVEQYDGSLWVLKSRGPRVANFVHSESGATLAITVEHGALAVATRF